MARMTSRVHDICAACRFSGTTFSSVKNDISAVIFVLTCVLSKIKHLRKNKNMIMNSLFLSRALYTYGIAILCDVNMKCLCQYSCVTAVLSTCWEFIFCLFVQEVSLKSMVWTDRQGSSVR